MPHRATQRTTIVDLPTDVFTCIVRHLEQGAWQRDETLDDIAALRSVCRALRRAVDVSVTHAAFHVNVGAAELRNIARRFQGLQSVRLQQSHCDVAIPTLEALVTLRNLRSLDFPILEDMQLEDWTQLSSLTGLTLRDVTRSNHGTLASVLPRLTMLRSLVLAEVSFAGLPAAGVQHLSSLRLLTHMDLGFARGVAALAAQLPNLQSLALCLPDADPRDRTVPLNEFSALIPLTRLRRLTLGASIDAGAMGRLLLDAYVMARCGVTCELPPSHHAVLPVLHRLAALLLVADTSRYHLYARYNRCGGRSPPAPLYGALQDLRLFDCNVSADMAAKLAMVAGRLHVLHLQGCRGALRQLLEAAVAVEDVSLRDVRGGDELLAALRPAARTLKSLDTSFIDGFHSELPHPDLDANHLTALSRLTRLAYGNCEEWGNAIAAIVQLTRLQKLQLHCPETLDDAEMAMLSVLSSLTSLELTGLQEESTGGWVAALAAARVPLRELQLRDDAVVPGNGAEAAIGQLARLTRLHISVDRLRTALLGEAGSPAMQDSGSTASTPLQLQLLGCGASTSNANSSGTISSSASGISAAVRNTGLQKLTLECTGPLSDAELAAAAASLPDLRRLKVGAPDAPDVLCGGLHGAWLAAFSACRRLRDVSLWRCDDLEAQQLVAQLPQISSLVSLQLVDCPNVDKAAVREVKTAFRAKHGRHLSVSL